MPSRVRISRFFSMATLYLGSAARFCAMVHPPSERDRLRPDSCLVCFAANHKSAGFAENLALSFEGRAAVTAGDGLQTFGGWRGDIGTDGQAAVDDHCLPGHPFRFIAREEQNHVGNIFRFAHARDRLRMTERLFSRPSKFHPSAALLQQS